MSSTATRYIDTVPWDRLEHAYGAAGDLPPFLEAVRSKNGRKLNHAMGELCARVLHQGTIYSASPPAVHVLIEMLADADSQKKEYLYGLLDAFADSARMAIEDGPAPPSCAGGDPADGAAIRHELTEARRRFEPDLVHPSSQVRGYVASLLTFIAVEDGSAADAVRHAYPAEQNTQVRNSMLWGLARLGSSFERTPDFWQVALARETDPSNRFVIRCTEILARKFNADGPAVADLVANFVASSDSKVLFGASEERFFEAIGLLGRDREIRALLEALQLAKEADLSRVLAERLLRLAFDDQRTGWGQTAQSLLKEDGSPPPQPDLYRMALRSIGMLLLYRLFPFLMRWRVRRMTRRKPKGIQQIRYWGLKGNPPAIPERLNEIQKTALTAFADKPERWQFRTNLWELYGLPGNAEDLRRFIGAQ